ncbi:MAG: bifunctional nuclease family protein, partial [Acidimicrobiia bacterium]|nr:bifunctional nuclease family protein [Acidimicrobiia bacterium]
MTVTGVRVELPSNTPIVLLRETAGTRFLPIWVGAVEAMAITAALEGVTPPRPLTHDLMASVIESLNAQIERIVVTELRNNVYYAELILTVEGREIVVSSRPSDAIALSVRTGAPVLASSSVLDEASIEFQDEELNDVQDEVEKFREMLQNITPDDFIDPGGSSEDPGSR